MKTSDSAEFADLVTCVVINLDVRSDRWKRVRKFCRWQGITANRFSAHDRERGLAVFPDSGLMPSERGLWSSFVTAVTAEYDTDWVLLLEDDAFLLPRFRRRLLREIRLAPPGIAVIRVGWTTRYGLDAVMKVRGNVFKLIRKGYQQRRRPAHMSQSSLEGRSTAPHRWGAHALLVRRSLADQLMATIGVAGAPLDGALIRAETNRPDLYVRSRAALAWQWPSRSDIHADRTLRRKLRTGMTRNSR